MFLFFVGTISILCSIWKIWKWCYDGSHILEIWMPENTEQNGIRRFLIPLENLIWYLWDILWFCFQGALTIHLDAAWQAVNIFCAILNGWQDQTLRAEFTNYHKRCLACQIMLKQNVCCLLVIQNVLLFFMIDKTFCMNTCSYTKKKTKFSCKIVRYLDFIN